MAEQGYALDARTVSRLERMLRWFEALAPAVLKNLRHRVIYPSPPKLVKYASNVTAGNSASFTVYEDTGAAQTWVTTGDTITVEVEFADYTANNKAVASMIAGRWRITMSEC